MIRRIVAGVLFVGIVAPGFVARGKDDERPAGEIAGIVVDEQGQPIEGVKVQSIAFSDRTGTLSAADGRFVLRFAVMPKFGLTLVAATATSDQQALFEQFGDTPVPTEIRLTLRPAREIVARIVDATDKPVPDAVLRVMQNFGIVGAATSDATGTARVLVPQDAALQFIYAFKPDVGLDYFIFRPREPNGTPENPFALPADHATPLDFVLNGTRTVTIRVVDDHDKPLAGFSVDAWYFEKPKKGGHLNISGAPDFHDWTDKDGRVVFRTVPADNVGRVTFWARHKDFFTPERPMFDPAAGTTELLVKVLPLVSVKGTVIGADGEPAANAEIAVVGDGYTFDGFRSATSSGPDGKFQIRVNPNEYYLFVAKLGKQASAAATLVVQTGEPAEEVRLTLQDATRVFGTVTEGQDNKPVADWYIQLYLKPDVDYSQLPQEEQLLEAGDNRKAVFPVFVQNTKTDAKGKYEFLAGPGKYYMICSRTNDKPPQFELADDQEFEVNFHSDLPARIDFQGQVVRQLKQKRGVAETRIEFAGTDVSAYPWEANGNKEGRFRVQRTTCEMLVHSRSEGGLLAGIAHLEPEDATGEIVVAPTASARGRIVDPDTGSPVPGIEIHFALQMRHTGGTTSDHFGGRIRTDAAGEFVATGLIPGQEFRITYVSARDADGSPRRWNAVGTIHPERAECLDLGEFRLEGPPREPIEALIRRELQSKTPYVQRLEQALADAQLGRQRLLVVVADKNAPALQWFFALYFNRAENSAGQDDLVEALQNFLVLAVDPAVLANDPQARGWAEKLKIDRPATDQMMQMIVLENDGTLVTQARAASFITDGKLQVRQLTAFLTENGPPVQDASKGFAAVLEQARRDDKRVLVVLGEPYSAPSLLMDRWLGSQRELLTRDFVLVRIDPRDENGEKTARRIRGEPGSVPWLAICEASGKPLATSDGPNGNVGYPANAADCRRLEVMFRTGARRLSDADVQKLIDAMP